MPALIVVIWIFERDFGVASDYKQTKEFSVLIQTATSCNDVNVSQIPNQYYISLSLVEDYVIVLKR